MMSRTKIEWTEEVWNPITGCSKVSAGCENCYAETMARRLKAMGRPEYQDAVNGKGNWTGVITPVPKRLEQPLRWRKPRMVFVNSMSDLFHPDVPDDCIYQVFTRMILASQHTYQILTKRPRRALDWFETFKPESRTNNVEWPLSNVWIGVSVENQQTAFERISYLLQIPATVRFISAEPLLGSIDLCVGDPTSRGPDWLIVGGESGPNARPMHPDWARSLRDQATAANVPFFFKQWGEWKDIQFDKRGQNDILVSPSRGKVDKLGDPLSDNPLVGGQDFQRTVAMCRVGKKVAGRLLDGREWNEFPHDTN